MSIYKFVGAGSILMSALLMYFEMQSYQKKRANQLDAFLSLIEYVKNQVECYMLPIDAIILSCDKKLLERCGVDIAREYKTLEEMIEHTDFYLENDALKIILEFVKDFGVRYRSEQIISCKRYYDLLIKEREKLKEKNTKERKVRLALCLSISFSIILLLI